MESGPSRAALLGALGAGAWLRLGGLGREGLWLDELFSWRVATRESWAAMIEDLARDVHPPGYFALLRLLAPPGAEDAALRLPSALAGLVTVVAAWVLGGRLGGNAAAAGAAWLVATAPGLVLLDREARGNALMAALAMGLLAVLTPKREVPDPTADAVRTSRRRLFVAAALAAMLVNVHLFGALVLFGVATWALLDPGLPRRAVVASVVAGGLALLPWASVLAGQVAGFVRDPWYGQPSPDSLGWVVLDLADERPGLLTIALLGLALALKRSPRAILLLVAMAGALVLAPQLLSYAVAPILRTRSALPLLPTLLVVSAVGFGGAGRVGGALLALLAAGQTLAAWHVTRLDTRMEQWREAAALVAKEAAPGDLVVANHPHLWRRYLPDATLLDAAEVHVDGAPGAWVLLGHDTELPPALASLLEGAAFTRDERLHGARVARVGPVGQPLVFTLPEGAPGRADGTRIELWGAGEAVTGPLRVRGRCAVEVRATEDAAGTERARLQVRVYGDGAWLDEEIEVGHGSRTGGRTPPIHGEPGSAEARVSVRFVNDAVVDGADRNVHIDEVRLRCE